MDKLHVENPPRGRKTTDPSLPSFYVKLPKRFSLLGDAIVLVNIPAKLVDVYYLDTITVPNSTVQYT